MTLWIIYSYHVILSILYYHNTLIYKPSKCLYDVNTRNLKFYLEFDIYKEHTHARARLYIYLYGYNTLVSYTGHNKSKAILSSTYISWKRRLMLVRSVVLPAVGNIIQLGNWEQNFIINLLIFCLINIYYFSLSENSPQWKTHLSLLKNNGQLFFQFRENLYHRLVLECFILLLFCAFNPVNEIEYISVILFIKCNRTNSKLVLIALGAR